MKGLPYQNATSGKNALQEIESILRRFGCSQVGTMMDYEKGELLVQFKYRETPVSIRASIKGYAVAWLKENPWTGRRRCSRQQHEAEAQRVAGLAVYSIVRDWIKGQCTAVEAGILAFQAAFLGQILLPEGRTVYEKLGESGMLALEDKSGAKEPAHENR